MKVKLSSLFLAEIARATPIESCLSSLLVEVNHQDTMLYIGFRFLDVSGSLPGNPRPVLVQRLSRKGAESARDLIKVDAMQKGRADVLFCMAAEQHNYRKYNGRLLVVNNRPIVSPDPDGEGVVVSTPRQMGVYEARMRCPKSSIICDIKLLTPVMVQSLIDHLEVLGYSVYTHDVSHIKVRGRNVPNALLADFVMTTYADVLLLRPVGSLSQLDDLVRFLLSRYRHQLQAEVI